MSASNRARRAADRFLYALLGKRWLTYRAKRAWDARADNEPLVATAAHDATDWETYWASGRRDLDLILGVARESGRLGTGTALEIGCGIGRLARLAAAEFDQVIATDISAHMLQLAREKAASPNVKYVLLGADQKLPAGDGSVDLVYAWTVFRHTSEVIFGAYLDEAWRVLKPEACLTFEALIREAGEPFKPSLSNPLSEREYSLEELDEYRRRHGFRQGSGRTIDSLTSGTSNLVVAWSKDNDSRSA